MKVADDVANPFGTTFTETAWLPALFADVTHTICVSVDDVTLHIAFPILTVTSEVTFVNFVPTMVTVVDVLPDVGEINVTVGVASAVYVYGEPG